MASEPENWADVTERPVTPTWQADHSIGVFARRTWRVLEYSSAYLALIAAAEVLIVIYLLSLPLTLAPLVGVLITFAVYANDRLVDIETDSVSNPLRTAFVRRHQRKMYVLAALAYGLGAALSAFGGPLAFGIAVFPGAVWLVYAVDWLRVPTIRFDRLKEVPVVSSLVVSAAWSLGVVLMPVAFASAPITPAVGVLFVYFTLATFVNAEVANVHDVESDTENGVVTVPTILGVERTRTVLYAVALFALTVLGGTAFLGILSASSAAILTLGIACLFGVVALVGRTKYDDALTVAAECTRLPVFVVLTVLAFL